MENNDLNGFVRLVYLLDCDENVFKDSSRWDPVFRLIGAFTNKEECNEFINALIRDKEKSYEFEENILKTIDIPLNDTSKKPLKAYLTVSKSTFGYY